MSIILTVFLKIIMPIFSLIAVGMLCEKLLRLDLRTLSKLNFYVLVPAMIFMKLLEAEVHGGLLARVGCYALAQVAVMFAIAWTLTRHRLLQADRAALTMAGMIYNCGNFGIPFVTLAFGTEMVAILAAVIMVQNPVCFIAGAMLMQGRRISGREVLRQMAGLPVLYAVMAALLIRSSGMTLPGLAAVPLKYLADALVPVALLTLGAQLARSLSIPRLTPLLTGLSLRLLLSPLVTWGLVWLFGFPPEVSAALIAVAGLPVAVNVCIVALEYQHDPELVAQLICWSTLLAAVTLSIIVALVGGGILAAAVPPG